MRYVYVHCGSSNAGRTISLGCTSHSGGPSGRPHRLIHLVSSDPPMRPRHAQNTGASVVVCTVQAWINSNSLRVVCTGDCGHEAAQPQRHWTIYEICDTISRRIPRVAYVLGTCTIDPTIPPIPGQRMRPTVFNQLRGGQRRQTSPLPAQADPPAAWVWAIRTALRTQYAWKNRAVCGNKISRRVCPC